MAGVGKAIENLEFVAQHIETAYLNEDRVHDRFTASSDAISTWVAKASKGRGGKVGLWGVGLEAQADSANEVTYDIKDSMAQAMILRHVVEDSQLLRPLGNAEILEYVVVSGKSCFRHPSLPGMGGGHTEACESTDELEEQRAEAEAIYQAFDPNARAWLLIVQLKGGGRAAASAHQKWINDSVIARFSHRKWTTFGVLQDRIGNVPFITPISVFVNYAKASS